jgi:GNAT superfamily N-acetyltransferase
VSDTLPEHDPGELLNRVERFDPARHDVSAFSCGNPTLDDYVRRIVARDEAQHTAATYVALTTGWPSESQRVFGFYTINSFSFPKQQARRRDRDKHLGGYDPVAAVLIGRLALDREFQGRGLGGALLTSALAQVLKIRETLGVAAVVVHAIDEGATTFYERHGFTRFRDEPTHLYFPLSVFALRLGNP